MQPMNRRPALRLPRRRMEAIQQALIHRLAGEIEEPGSELTPRDYDAALAWVSDRLQRRSTHRPARSWRRVRTGADEAPLAMTIHRPPCPADRPIHQPEIRAGDGRLIAQDRGLKSDGALHPRRDRRVIHRILGPDPGSWRGSDSSRFILDPRPPTEAITRDCRPPCNADVKHYTDDRPAV